MLGIGCKRTPRYLSYVGATFTLAEPRSAAISPDIADTRV